MSRPSRVKSSVGARPGVDAHPLVRDQENLALFSYEESVKNAFDSIVPTLRNISALQHEADFEVQAQQIARDSLGFELPQVILANAWIEQLDMRRLFAWCVFETYHRFCDDFFSNDHLITERDFLSFLTDCGFHTFDISPCADGRLAHVISYVLRLPYKEVRRKSYAGGMFDIEDSLTKWTETELKRFREGIPTTADQPTRYLKTVVYHYSNSQPDHEGCAAHGSDAGRAAAAGRDRLYAFQQAVQNSFCCGASIDLMLIGLDTDSDAIRIHVSDNNGQIDLEQYVDAESLYEETLAMNADQAMATIESRVQATAPHAEPGMIKLVGHLLGNNMSQIQYVKEYFTGCYDDIGHAERFIGAGIGFEEIQLRNLTYFAYLHTVEEAAGDLDVGIKIFSNLNASQGLPIPVVVRYDYHGNVPGAKERAIENCQRVASAMKERYRDLVKKELLHTLLVVRDCANDEPIEILESSVDASVTRESH
jgi:carboxysome shell carbonic anhydrase